MTAMADCIFCALANGEIPTDMMYENERAAAFRDMNPAARVHVLVVPKKHYDNIGDDVDAETLAAMVEAVKKVAELEGIAESGYRVIANTGADAGQTVNHFHMHVLGGEDLGEALLAKSE
jgi:histidine triad (HIT) family protein